MLKVYMMPDGVMRQYHEGNQPKGAVLVEAKEAPKAEPKRRATRAKKEQ